MTVQVLEGDSLHLLRAMDDCSVDAVVTDPPYGLSQHKPNAIANVLAAWVSGDRDATLDGKGFMGKAWDAFVPPPGLWDEVLRVLKPGGHACVFAGSRTVDLMGLSLRLAGFELRDTVEWLYGSGFPKSLDVSKAIDKRGGNPHLASQIGKALKDARERRGITVGEADRLFCDGTTNWSWFEGRPRGQRAPTPETFSRIVAEWPELRHLADKVEEAERQVVGTKTSGIANSDEGPRHTIGASKAVEVDVTTAATDAARQWDGWGTALKPAHEPVLVARKPLAGTVAGNVLEWGTGALNIDGCRVGTDEDTARKPVVVADTAAPFGKGVAMGVKGHAAGRWPANIVLDGAAADALDQQSGVTSGRVGMTQHSSGTNSVYGAFTRSDQSFGNDGTPDTGGASRFFTRADYGPDDWPFLYCAKPSRRERNAGLDSPSTHPTVKPVALMRHLVRLVTQPGGTVLDPFAGSGTTLVAAVHEHVNAIGFEIDPDYATIARARVRHAQGHTPEPDVTERSETGQHPTLPGV